MRWIRAGNVRSQMELVGPCNDHDGLMAALGKALYLLPGGGEGWRPARLASMLG